MRILATRSPESEVPGSEVLSCAAPLCQCLKYPSPSPGVQWPFSQGYYGQHCVSVSLVSLCGLFKILKIFPEKGFVVHQTAREIHGAKGKVYVKWILIYLEPSDIFYVEFQKTGSMALQTFLLLQHFSLYLITVTSCDLVHLGAHHCLNIYAKMSLFFSSSFVTDLLYLIPWSVWPQLLASQGCWEPKKPPLQWNPSPSPWLRFHSSLSLKWHLHRNPEGLFLGDQGWGKVAAPGFPSALALTLQANLPLPDS